MRKRMSWDEYFIKFAELAASRSTCLRRQHGAIIVKENQILATGYNASPSKHPHCDDCLREHLSVPSGTRYELCRSVHAEQNALLQAAKHGVSVAGATMYITGYPCMLCARLICNSGIVRLVLENDALREATSIDTFKYSEMEILIINHFP